MEISKRLKMIVNHIDECSSIIDVGTDHGYIPIYLVKNNICQEIIASDINKGPIEKAKFNINIEGFKKFISCRLGPGLSVVKNYEVEAVIIAGMGGNLTREILEEDIEKVENFKFLLLQPAQNPEVLREYLYKNNYKIIDEDICFDEGKFYELFKVKYDKDNDGYKINDEIDLEISPIIRKKDKKVVREFIQSKINKYEKILKHIKEDTDAAIQRKKEIENKIFKLREML